MSRYIKLSDLIDGNYTNVCPSIMKLPSIDIVRCKECENWQTDWVPEEYECVEDLHYCAVVDGCKFDDFFCADGERREP